MPFHSVCKFVLLLAYSSAYAFEEAPADDVLVWEKRAEEQYTETISERIRRFQHYPDQARKYRMQGKAILAIAVGADGNVKNVALLISSGYDLLDKVAIDMATSAAPFPRAPLALRGRRLSLRVPIAFRIVD